MTIFVVNIGGEAQKEAFTSLKTLCNRYGLSYSSAYKGKRSWSDNNLIIQEFEVKKMKPRGSSKV